MAQAPADRQAVDRSQRPGIGSQPAQPVPQVFSIA
jgi:hypothetical protein